MNILLKKDSTILLKYVSGIKRFCVVFFLLIQFSANTYSQSIDDFDEISVTLNVQKIGSLEIGILIKSKDAYLPVKDILDFIKIKNTLFLDEQRIEGFFIAPEAIFTIEKNKIVYQGKVFNLNNNELVTNQTNLYLKSDLFSKVFALDCIFNFRALYVVMSTKIELPAIKEMQQEVLRQNISKLKGEKKADSTIARTYQALKLGVADWTLFSNYNSAGELDSRLNFALGGVILGGEASAMINANSNTPLRGSEQIFRWRHVNNNFAPLRQVTLGSIFTTTTSTLFAPITGIQFTNTPTTFRRSFGTYNISNKTEPGWTVELFVNNVLVNYTKADASGFFSFDIPLVYGNSEIKYRFYGPWGEVRTSEQQISIPFNFLPQNQFEYTITSGIVQDEDQSKMVRATMNYGLNRRVTIGGGVEYLSTANNAKPMPFITTSIRIGSNLLFSGEHVEGVISRGIFSYNLPSNIRLEVNYGKFEKNQTAIRAGKGSINNFLEERKLVAIIPIRTKKFSSYTRLTINQLVLPTSTFNISELLLSAIFKSTSLNITTQMAYSDPAEKLITSNFSLITRLPKGIRFTPLVQYDYISNQLIRVRGELEKNIGNRGFVNFTYERDLTKNLNFFNFGFRYNFSFANIAFFGRKSKDATVLTQTINGSFLNETVNNKILISNQNNLGRGGFIVQAFLDINANGKKDIGEPKISEIKLRVNSGRIQFNKKDSNYLVSGLEAYNSYFIEILKNGFDNITWKVKRPIIQAEVEPNQIKLIEVPVSVMGEVTGRVDIQNQEKSIAGIGRIIVNIYSKNGELIDRTLSESDGYFSYIGLNPGQYYASIDENQLNKLKINIQNNKIEFTIKASRDGDIVEGLNFKLLPSSFQQKF